jgi:hypothetical protein
MISDDDWRLTGQEAYLTNAVLYFQRWATLDPTWDHDQQTPCY